MTSCSSGAVTCERTYFDIPRLRTSTSGGYLTSGIAYAWHPTATRGTPPRCSSSTIWMPVYAIEAANAMAFHPEYFDVAVPNSSDVVQLLRVELEAPCAAASSNIGAESRPLPEPTVDVDISDPMMLRAGRRRVDRVLRAAPPLERARITPAGPGSRSTSERCTSTTSSAGGPPRTWTRVHRFVDPRLHSR